jgi:hypothetical protein
MAESEFRRNFGAKVTSAEVTSAGEVVLEGRRGNLWKSMLKGPYLQ